MLKKITNTIFKKQYLVIIALSSLYACSNDDTLNDDALKVANNIIIFSECDVVNSDPFSEDFVTYGNLVNNCETLFPDSELDCFPVRLKEELEATFNTLAGLDFPGTSADTSFSHSLDPIPFSDMGVTSDNFYPSIDSKDAGKIYAYLFCQIREHLDSLSELPVKGTEYYPVITNLATDFTFSGPDADNSFILEFDYDVKVYTRPIR